MYEFDIPDMSCNHCIAAITTAIRTVDPDATADIDLAKRTAIVTSKADPQRIEAAIQHAGYASSHRSV